MLVDWTYEQLDDDIVPDFGEDTEFDNMVITNKGYLYSNDPERQEGIYIMNFSIKYLELKKKNKGGT